MSRMTRANNDLRISSSGEGDAARLSFFQSALLVGFESKCSFGISAAV
jgi:hypothetical protein